MPEQCVRFVHCGDLHLDDPFERLGDVPAAVREVLRGASFRSWDRVVDLALERKVDFVLGAGDLFEDEDRSLRAQLALVKGLERLSSAGVAVFLVHGNHDALSGWEPRISFPSGVHRFDSRVEHVPFRRDGDVVATIHGYSYPQRGVTENVAVQMGPRGEGFQIALLHANVGCRQGHGNYAPCTLKDLEASGMDYWALGHIHQAAVLRAASPAVVYPGTPQGRLADETGPRGCYVVTLSAAPPELEFVETDVLRRERVSLDIAPFRTEQEMVRALEALRQEIRSQTGRPVLLRVDLRGRGELHGSLSRPGFRDDLLAHIREGEELREDFVWVEDLENRTASPADGGALRRGDHFVGDFLRSLDALRSAENVGAHVAAILDADPEYAGWNSREVALLVEELLGRDGDGLSAEAKDLFDRVEVLGLDGLLRKEA